MDLIRGRAVHVRVIMIFAWETMTAIVSACLIRLLLK
jgi:hypothetical protein